ncbi:MAG: protein kinase [Xanthomonadales bacterium]|nr:protein kinase [Xanthomonadales bacterium]
MQPERYARIKAVLEQVIEAPADQRAALLDHHCAEQASLRGEVEELLRAGEAMTTRFLEQAPVALPQGQQGAAEVLQPGAVLGRFRVERLLGRGGMGEVYAGTDEVLERPVAIKLMRAALRLSPAERTRFLTEAQLLSRLRHPNVCEVYDFFEGDQQDVLVLELIEGKTLRALLDAGAIADPLSIAIQVGQALEAAHQRGTVHRDLKPENIMVTDSGVAKVLDFGLARSENRNRIASGGEQSGLSGDRTLEESGIMGTLGYMAPEQARGERAGAASDVYSFGLLLQELLTGQAPFEPGPDLLARCARAESREPIGLSAELTRLIRRLKHPDPSLRPTATDVLTQLQQIAELPRLRLQRRLRRTAVAVVVLAAIAIAVQSWFVAREAERAKQARLESESALQFLVDLIESADPGNARGERLTVAEVLENGVARLRSDMSDVPLARARLLHTIGVVDAQLERLPRSRELLGEALAARSALLPASDPSVLETQRRLAEVENHLGETEAALQRINAALTVARDEDPESEQVADLLQSQVLMMIRSGKMNEAAALAERAIALYEKHGGPNEPRIAQVARQLELAYSNQRRYPEAVVIGERALAISRQLHGADHPDLVSDLYRLSHAVNYTGDFDRGMKLLDESEAMARRLYGDQHSSVAVVLVDRGQVLYELGEIDRAIDLIKQGVAIYRQLDRKFDLLYGLKALQSKLTLAKRYDEGLEVCLEVWSTRRQLLQPGHPELAVDDIQIGHFLSRNGYYGPAVTMMERALVGLRAAVETEPETYTEPLDITVEQLKLTRQLVAEKGVGETPPAQIVQTLGL